ncbi:hypothetical protein OESDEN_02073 [Oesophagostomum dentatum]|uniref:Uncharacterized protein n=1 Tax=Oesophagostomum dentatum TaxID=61180 RepID=A0A0B1TK50_OESDE|nr:hypothetical protein OESDEN_02073 [Oesophagostomum dentatum]
MYPSVPLFGFGSRIREEIRLLGGWSDIQRTARATRQANALHESEGSSGQEDILGAREQHYSDSVKPVAKL